MSTTKRSPAPTTINLDPDTQGLFSPVLLLHMLCLSFNKKSQGMLKGKEQNTVEGRQASELESYWGTITWGIKDNQDQELARWPSA